MPVASACSRPSTATASQHYRDEHGELVEVVALFKRNGEAETPFMRFEERAALFVPRRFDKALTQ